MKCDNCIFQKGFVLTAEEGGGYHIFCKKGHWEGGGNFMKGGFPLEHEQDLWKDCPDFEPLPLHEGEEFKL